MAPRPHWNGYLKLSLVTCAVSLTPAVSAEEKVRFHTVNAETGHRVRSRYVDAETGRPVAEEDQVKGYETGKDHFVMLEDEELEAAALERARTIDIERFVPADSIAWIWRDAPYYVKPEDDVAQEAFAVIRESMAATDTVGISRLVLSNRERAVMLEPRGKGIVLWTLRYGDELQDAADVFDDDRRPKKADAKLIPLIETLIDKFTRPWDPSMVGDPVQERLKEIIAGKRGRKPRKGQVGAKAPAPGNVVDIMDALKRSIAAEKKK